MADAKGGAAIAAGDSGGHNGGSGTSTEGSGSDSSGNGSESGASDATAAPDSQEYMKTLVAAAKKAVRWVPLLSECLMLARISCEGFRFDGAAYAIGMRPGNIRCALQEQQSPDNSPAVLVFRTTSTPFGLDTADAACAPATSCHRAAEPWRRSHMLMAHWHTHQRPCRRFAIYDPVRRRAADMRRQAHVRDAHPYEPFPLAELEAAVDAAEYPKAEAALNHFGASTRYRYFRFRSCMCDCLLWSISTSSRSAAVAPPPARGEDRREAAFSFRFGTRSGSSGDAAASGATMSVTSTVPRRRRQCCFCSSAHLRRACAEWSSNRQTP